jgi:pimeloyl-ACP methyl ester carboxylesterase
MFFRCLWFWLLEAWEMGLFILLIPLSWFWQAPLPSKQNAAHAQKKMVLVPGFLGRGLELLPLRRELQAAGFEVWIVPLGFQASDIATKGQKLAAYLETHGLQDCYLLGYSLGGWVALNLPLHSRWRVSTLMTVGVAFAGTPMAWLLSPLQAARQLIPGSSFLKKQPVILAEGYPRHLNFSAQVDEITASRQTSALPLTERALPNRQATCLPVWGHLNLVRRRQARQALIASLLADLNANRLSRTGSQSVVELEQDVFSQFQAVSR